MTETINQTRAATFQEIATKLAAFADRQAQRGVTNAATAATQAAELAAKASAAYAAGDKTAGAAARAEYVAFLAAHSFLQGIA